MDRIYHVKPEDCTENGPDLERSLLGFIHKLPPPDAYPVGQVVRTPDGSGGTVVRRNGPWSVWVQVRGENFCYSTTQLSRGA